MLWVRGEPFHEGNLFDLTLRDLLDLDLILARYKGSLRHWWEIPAAIDELNSTPTEERGDHPESGILLAVRVWGTMRANGRPDTFIGILDSGLRWDEVLLTKEPSEPAEQMPHGFRAGNVQSSTPDVIGMDIKREVGRYALGAMIHLHLTYEDLWRLPLWLWLGVAAQIDELRR